MNIIDEQLNQLVELEQSIYGGNGNYIRVKLEEKTNIENRLQYILDSIHIAKRHFKDDNIGMALEAIKHMGNVIEIILNDMEEARKDVNATLLSIN